MRALALTAALMATACAPRAYQSGARTVGPNALGDGWLRVRSLPPRPQRGDRDCGAAALASVLGYWKIRTSVGAIDRALRTEGRGIRAGRLRDYARAQGLRAYLLAGSMVDLVHELERGRPVIVGMLERQGARTAFKHYEVVVAVRPDLGEVVTYDPARGWRTYSRASFLAEWEPSGRLALLMLPRSKAQTGYRSQDRVDELQVR